MLEPIPFAGYMDIDEMNKPIAWIWSEDGCNMGVCLDQDKQIGKQEFQDYSIPLYTHPVKELHLSLQKEKETGELLAVTYTDDEHKIVEVLWQRPPVKELTDEEIFRLWQKHLSDDIPVFARAILKKARE